MNAEKNKIIKNDEPKSQSKRLIIQLLFAFITLIIGYEFSRFVHFLETNGTEGTFYRPAGVEAFLPISSLMSLKYFITTGEIHNIHPAGLFIFIAIVAVSFYVGKSFCSWICPIGLISELVGDFGEKIMKKLFKRTLRLPKWLDYPLRSLKYLLLLFFIYATIILMSPASLKQFLDSDYNIMSDVKMYHFFAHISKFSLIVISILFIGSIFIRNLWCRFLCPYGALLGLFSIISPNKIVRNEEKCIDCALCAKACPSRIKVDKVKTVISDECSSCLSCIDACPVKDTLVMKNIIVKKEVKGKTISYLIPLIYFVILSIGYFTGNWQNKVSKEDYIRLNKSVDSIGHPTGKSDIDEMNNQSRQGETNGGR